MPSVSNFITPSLVLNYTESLVLPAFNQYLVFVLVPPIYSWDSGAPDFSLWVWECLASSGSVTIVRTGQTPGAFLGMLLSTGHWPPTSPTLTPALNVSPPCREGKPAGPGIKSSIVIKSMIIAQDE